MKVNKKMNIVYVIGTFASGKNAVLGGMPRYVYKIARYMQGKGHDVTILTIGTTKKKWSYRGVPVYSVVLPRQCYGCNKLIQYTVLPVIREFAFNAALRRMDRESHISLVQYAGWYGVGMLYDRKYPAVLRISTYIKAQLPLTHTPFELAVISFEEKMAARNFNGIVAPSKALGNIYGDETGRKVKIIETPYYHSDREKEDDTLYKTKLSGKKYFLFFGRISPDKGVCTIARVIKDILRKYSDYYFCFAGNNFVSDKVNTIKTIQVAAADCSDRVKYLGSLTHETLFPVIRNAECIVMPSLMDNLPNACLEALELNGIVIGTRGASFDEIFEDGVSGLLIDIDDSYALMKKIDYVMQMTDEEKERMKRNAKKCLSKYDPEITGEKLEQYYHKISSLRGNRKVNLKTVLGRKRWYEKNSHMGSRRKR